MTSDLLDILRDLARRSPLAVTKTEGLELTINMDYARNEINEITHQEVEAPPCEPVLASPIQAVAQAPPAAKVAETPESWFHSEIYRGYERNEINEKIKGCISSIIEGDTQDEAEEGKAPQEWDEGLARLHPDHPPADVPLHRWRTFIDDVDRFLDSGFAEKAATLGWEAHDLFGCDNERPFARIDQAGLLWLLNGDKLIALTENTATIELRTGARQIYRRKPSATRVLAWELCDGGRAPL